MVHQQPDSNLHPRFRNRLLDIAAHLERSNISGSNGGVSMDILSPSARSKPQFGMDEMFRMVDGLRAAYLADLIVR